MVDVAAEGGSATVTVETVFRLRGRGQVIALSGETGTIARNGVLWNGLSWVPYLGPEIIDGVGGRSALAVTVADHDIGNVAATHEVRFSLA